MSIQDIKIRRRSLEEVLPQPGTSRRPVPKKTARGMAKDLDLPPIESSSSNRVSGWIWFLILILFLGIGIWSFGHWWSRAKIEITPKSGEIFLEEKVTLNRAGAGNTGLAFESMTLPEITKSQTVAASGVEKISRRASGQVIIYNAFSTVSQRLIKNTRFQSPNGKIYRIDKDVVVPGLKTDTTGKKLPGTLEVTVYADQPGESYNQTLTDFKLPAFVGSPRYSTIYGRSKTSLTGGFVGEVKVVPEAAKTKAEEELKASLGQALTAAALAQVPTGYLSFPDAMVISYQNLSDFSARTTATSAEIKLSAKLSTILVGEQALINKLINNQVEALKGLPIKIVNLSKLTIQLDNKKSWQPATANQAVLLISGQAQLVADLDLTQIKERILDVKKSEAAQVFATFPGIERAAIYLNLPWLNRLPPDPKRIDLTVNDPFKH